MELELKRLSGAKVVVVGLGNLGSHLVSHLGRMVGGLVLIDRDRVEPKNVSNQLYGPADIGRHKAEAIASHLRQLNPQASIRPLVADIEELGLGWFRGDVLVSALDTRRGRQILNEIAWRLGVPLVDAAVGPELDGRVNVYLPGLDSPCLECSWSGDIDYALVGAAYPCGGGQESAPATSEISPSLTGGLIGAMEAAQVVKVLLGQWEKAAVGWEVYLNALHHRFFSTRILRNPECRFDHQTWHIEPLGRGTEATAGELLDLLEERYGGGLSLSFRQPFVGRAACRRCGAFHEIYRAVSRLHDFSRPCSRCGEKVQATAFDLIGAWGRGEAPPFAQTSLSELGIPEKDVVTARIGGLVLHFELA